VTPLARPPQERDPPLPHPVAQLREHTAGRIEIEANIATATTVIVPTAKEVKVGSPLSSIPAIAVSALPESSSKTPLTALAALASPNWSWGSATVLSRSTSPGSSPKLELSASSDDHRRVLAVLRFLDQAE
jgi:hypothetical protein